jgi:hypothetical protein
MKESIRLISFVSAMKQDPRLFDMVDLSFEHLEHAIKRKHDEEQFVPISQHRVMQYSFMKYLDDLMQEVDNIIKSIKGEKPTSITPPPKKTLFGPLLSPRQVILSKQSKIENIIKEESKEENVELSSIGLIINQNYPDTDSIPDEDVSKKESISDLMNRNIVTRAMMCLQSPVKGGMDALNTIERENTCTIIKYWTKNARIR